MSDLKLIIESNENGKRAQDTLAALKKTFVATDSALKLANRRLVSMLNVVATQYKNNFDLQTRITRDSTALINNSVEIAKRDYAIDRFIKARKTRKGIFFGTALAGTFYIVGRFLFHIF